ncbi:hypothetical protein [Salegentibacter mishustinae]|jgi:hypothetical protein|nr:hypothetical protein [Salegentibacter mishustinae]PZX62462.1 hypothetical protein LY54_02422 [Salegentibacter mishustinae]|tara:strand:- start:321 stop:455 length:135 start_codon:yes stop_codon:yes gene_type:complete
MKLLNTIALVNWEMGSFLIAIFGVVCAGLILIVFNMINSGKDKE